MDKATFLKKLEAGRAAWEAVLARVDDRHASQPGVSGEMSVKDIIAHVAWYENQMVGLIKQRALIGSDLWYKTLDERNAAILEINRDRPLDEIQTEAQQVYEQFIAGVRSLSDDDLNDSARFAQMPAEWIPWEVIASNCFEHYPQHIPDIEAWLARQEG